MRIVQVTRDKYFFPSFGNLGKNTLSLDTQVVSRRQPMTGLTTEYEHQLRRLRVCGLSHSSWLRSLCWQHSWLPPCPQVSLAPTFLEHEFPCLTSCGFKKDLWSYGSTALYFVYSLQLLITMKFEALERTPRTQDSCLQQIHFNLVKNISPNQSEY